MSHVLRRDRHRNSRPSPNSRPAPSRWALAAQVALAGRIALVAWIALFGAWPPSGSALVAAAEAPAGPVERVLAAPVVKKTLTLSTTQPASIEPYEQTPLHSKLAGYVDEVLVDIGARVTKDQPLVRLWMPELADDRTQREALLAQAEAELQQAQAGITAAAAGVRTAEAQRAAAEAGVARTNSEFGRWQAEANRIIALAASGTVTAKLADEARNSLRAAEASQAEAAAQVRSAQAMIEEAQARATTAAADEVAAAAKVQVAAAELARAVTMANYAVLKAPYDGVITARNVDPRHFVQPGGGGGPPLVVVTRSDKVRVVAAVPESEAPLVTVDGPDPDPATVTTPALGGRRFEAPVARTSWSLDPLSRSLKVEIELLNADGALRPGMFAMVEIRLASIPDAVTAPATAVVRDGGETFCCVVERGLIVRRAVQLGLRSGADQQIVSGLEAGELLVQTRAAGLKPGQRVEVLAPPPAK